MINYGDSEFRNWATENNLDEEDLNLIKKTCAKRMFIYFLFGGGWTIMPIVSTLFVKEWVQYKIIKQGTFNPRQGFLCSIAALCHIVSFITIIPFIFSIINCKGTFLAINYLFKKGFIGCGNDGRTRYEAYKKIKLVPRIIRVAICLVLAAISYVFLTQNEISSEIAIEFAASTFIFTDLIGAIVTTIIDNIKYKKWLNS